MKNFFLHALLMSIGIGSLACDVRKFPLPSPCGQISLSWPWKIGPPVGRRQGGQHQSGPHPVVQICTQSPVESKFGPSRKPATETAPSDSFCSTISSEVEYDSPTERCATLRCPLFGLFRVLGSTQRAARSTQSRSTASERRQQALGQRDRAAEATLAQVHWSVGLGALRTV